MSEYLLIHINFYWSIPATNSSSRAIYFCVKGTIPKSFQTAPRLQTCNTVFFQLPFSSVELLGGGITIVDHPQLCFLLLHYNIAVLVAAMLLLSFLSDRRFLSPSLYSFIFFEIFTLDLGEATMPTLAFC